MAAEQLPTSNQQAADVIFLQRVLLVAIDQSRRALPLLTLQQVLAVCMEVKLLRDRRHLLHLVSAPDLSTADCRLAICSRHTAVPVSTRRPHKWQLPLPAAFVCSRTGPACMRSSRPPTFDCYCDFWTEAGLRP